MAPAGSIRLACRGGAFAYCPQRYFEGGAEYFGNGGRRGRGGLEGPLEVAAQPGEALEAEHARTARQGVRRLAKLVRR